MARQPDNLSRLLGLPLLSNGVGSGDTSHENVERHDPAKFDRPGHISEQNILPPALQSGYVVAKEYGPRRKVGFHAHATSPLQSTEQRGIEAETGFGVQIVTGFNGVNRQTAVLA